MAGILNSVKAVDGEDSEENERLPLKQRLKLLLAAAKPLNWKDGSLLDKQGSPGLIEADKHMSPNHISHMENTDINKSSGPAFLTQTHSAVVKVEQMDSPVSLTSAYMDDLSMTKKQAAVEIQNLVKDNILDDLDHVALIVRQNMLLQKELKSASNVQESSSGMGCRVMDSMMPQIPEIGEDKRQFENRVQLSVLNNCKESHKTMLLDSANGEAGRLSQSAQIPTIQNSSQEMGANKVTNEVRRGNNDKRRFFPKVLSQHKQCGEKDLSIRENLLNSLITASVNVKAEPLDGTELERIGKDSSRVFSSDMVQVKTEHELQNNSGRDELERIGKDSSRVFSSDMVQVKTEHEPQNYSGRDELDHMLLSERMKLSSRKLPQLGSCENLDCSYKAVSSSLTSQPNIFESGNSLKASRPKKRRKTATDSIETALEEDAPGLLQALMEKGVAVDEMKLYGQSDNEDALDDSSLEESFSGLATVISQLFSQRSSLLKFPPLRCNKVEKISYCLACLFSLVEQARYLRSRNWPVEWGWCRDLQSFIFVFERHNRIVLERPEYGYATYFFELVNTLPIDWQLKRLVIAMKLASCSRVALIENRALMIGDDMTEGEARVLMEYGWIPNSGLGTMLNYCDRVVHDRRNEKDSSEWRSKIGKMLVDGYNSGTMVPSCIPVKVEEYNEIVDVNRFS